MSELQTKIANIVKSNTEYSGDIEQLVLATNLHDIGINSITFIKIVIDLEKEFNIEFSDEFLDVNQISNFQDLVKCVEKMI